MSEAAQWLAYGAAPLAALLVFLRQRLPRPDRPWWVGALLERPTVAAACGLLLASGAPEWLAAPTRQLLPPAFLFLAGWLGLEVGCSLDLRVVRRVPASPFVNEAAGALATTLVLLTVAFAAERLLPGVAPLPSGGLLVLVAICICGPAMARGGAALSRGAGRGEFWQPSVAAALAALWAAAGSGLSRWPVVETVIPGWDATIPLEIDSVTGRLIWGVGAGCVAGLVADLATKDDFAPGGVYPQLAAVVLMLAGVCGAIGLETQLAATVAGFWLINATLRRLDILHVLERGAAVPRLLAPFLGGWFVGGGWRVDGFDGAVFVQVLAVVLLLRPAARVVGRHLLPGGADTARRRPETAVARRVEVDELGLLLTAVLTRLLPGSAGVAAMAAVLLAQWLLGLGARAWDWRQARAAGESTGPR